MTLCNECYEPDSILCDLNQCDECDKICCEFDCVYFSTIQATICNNCNEKDYYKQKINENYFELRHKNNEIHRFKKSCVEQHLIPNLANIVMEYIP